MQSVKIDTTPKSRPRKQLSLKVKVLTKSDNKQPILKKAPPNLRLTAPLLIRLA